MWRGTKEWGCLGSLMGAGKGDTWDWGNEVRARLSSGVMP